MLEILNKCKETVVKEKELLDIVGVSIERIRQHGLTEYCIELGNLLICIQNRYLLIMTNLDKQLQCYTSALNGCPYTISIDTEEQEKNDKKIDEIRLRLGI